MTALTPAQIAQKWSTSLGSATTTMQAGAQAVQVSPGVAAAKQKQVWLNNTTASVDKWAKNTAAVSLSDWQTAYVQKGIPRIASGATASQPKMEAFMNALLPYQANAVNQLPARGTYDQNKARAIQWMDKMHAFSYKGQS